MSTVTVPQTPSAAHKHAITPADRRAYGKRLREAVPRSMHKAWQAAPDRLDPIGILRAADAAREPELVPLRYGRMLPSPFTFYRGSAGIMAADLARTPISGIYVQACGDCHLLNFGGFATPERRLILDINDFDETLPAPWEWDVKRLIASVVLAARSNGLSDANGRDAAIACARSYRQNIRDFGAIDVLDVWYARLEDRDILPMLPEQYRAGLKNELLRLRPPAVRSCCFQSWLSRRVVNRASAIYRRSFFMPSRHGLVGICKSSGIRCRNIAKPCPTIDASCSIAITSSTRRSRLWASAALGRCAWWS